MILIYKGTDKCMALIVVLIYWGLKKNGHHFVDSIFFDKNYCVLIKIALKIISKGFIDKYSALVQVMAQHNQIISHYRNQCSQSSATPYIVLLGHNKSIPDSKVHGANMLPTWVLSAPDGPHVGPTKVAIRDTTYLIWQYNKARRLEQSLSFIRLRPGDVYICQ